MSKGATTTTSSSGGGPGHGPSAPRVVVHVDCDSFYCQERGGRRGGCVGGGRFYPLVLIRQSPAPTPTPHLNPPHPTQVEYRRLGIPSDVPLAVNQWGGLIAVSYLARAYGVRRGDR